MRSYFRFFTQAPQPLKAFMVLYVLSLVFGFVAIPLGISWALAPLGATAILYGLTTLLNVNGSASKMAVLMKNERPMGVDYSKSFISSPVYVRAIGAGMVVVGITFIVAGINS